MLKKLKTLSKPKKILLGAGALLVLIGAVGAGSPQKTEHTISQASDVKTESLQQESNESEDEILTVEESQSIPFQSTTENDPSLPAGQTVVVVAGVVGEKIITFEVTYVDGTETSRRQVSERVSREPVSEVKKVGTKVKAASNCDENYSGCVPIASDVDCAGGSGDGPAYVSGPISVIGYDVYGLDRDGNGIACE
jgi:hypothetical protein